MGYGAGAVNPYLAFESLHDLLRQGLLPGVTHDQAVLRYIKALNKGVLKVMSKMGISTLQSYCGAQIFEAVGLDRAFVDKYFTGTASRLGGVGLPAISEEVRRRHARAFGPRAAGPAELESGGEYQWRRDGEIHLFNPETVFKLQHATRTGQYEHLQGVHPAGRRPEPAPRDAARPVPLQAGWARRCRSTRSSRSRRSCRASPPARCPTARSARKRTRRWRSR